MDDCLFCGIVAGAIPSTKVDEDERTIAFLDINPASDGHLLVVPKAHARDVTEIGADDLTAVMLTAQRLTGRVLDVLGADGVNLLNNCGATAWQSVFHFHLHLIPRYADTAERSPGDHRRDEMTLPFVPHPGDPDTLAAIADLLR